MHDIIIIIMIIIIVQTYNPSRTPPRSTTRSLLAVPGPKDVKTKLYGQRAFRYTATILWNALPDTIRESDTKLKTLLFCTLLHAPDRTLPVGLHMQAAHLYVLFHDIKYYY